MLPRSSTAAVTGFRPAPACHWRSYGTEPLPSPADALDLPLAAFPSWFLKITCDRCGQDRMLSESHTPERQRETPIRVLLHRVRHDGCGGRAGVNRLLRRGACDTPSALTTTSERDLRYHG